MTLDHWLTTKKINAEEFGRRLSATGEAVRQWARGSRMPGAEFAEAIVTETGGEVTVQDLHNVRLEYLNKTEAAA